MKHCMSKVGQTSQYKYRRQFVLAEQQLEGLSGWDITPLGERYFIHTHPDLDACRYMDVDNNFELVLLGFMLNPDEVDWNNQEVLNAIGANAKGDFDVVIQETYRKGGRWLLFYHKDDVYHVFADPAGLRSFFYIADPNYELIAASQSNLITDYQPFEISETARTDFLETSAYTEQIEYMIPAGFSLYDEIKHLIPNHYFNLSLRQSIRFFPNTEKPRYTFEEGVDIVTGIFEKLMIAASKRFKLALAVTAGYDSRIMMAATRNLPETKYYTLKYYKLDETSNDIAIPHKMIEKVGRVHEIFDCTEPMPTEFEELYTANVHCAHPAWGNIAYGLSKHFPEGHVAVKGNCGEIGRRYYYKFDYPGYEGPALLTKLAHYEATPFGQEALRMWYEEINPAVEKYDYELLDFLYWEFRQGSWQSMSQLEWDIVQEVFVPLNCRAVVQTMLGVDPKYRDAIESKLQRAVINNYWPVMLTVPSNPPSLKFRLYKLRKNITSNEIYQKFRDGVKKLLNIKSFHREYSDEEH